MDNQDWKDYVQAASRLHGLALDPDREGEVIVQLGRIHDMVRGLLEYPLPPEIEPAPVFRP